MNDTYADIADSLDIGLPNQSDMILNYVMTWGWTGGHNGSLLF